MHDNELQSFELAGYADAIANASRSCQVGHACETTRDSYFGGMPLVPCDFQWPTKDGYPLAFIGQLHCSDVDIVPSDEGDLLFFYDNRHWGYAPGDRGHVVVIHLPASSTRVATELPTFQVPVFFGLRKKLVRPKVYQRININFGASTSYPSWERNLVAFSDDVAEECYIEFCNSVQSSIQIGGYPSPVQSDSMELDCVKSMRLGTRNDWVLLLQLFEVGNMAWGDAGGSLLVYS